MKPWGAGSKNTRRLRHLIFAVGALLAIAFIFLILNSRDALREHSPVPFRHEANAGTEPRVPQLEIKTVVQHGHIFEVQGVAEPGSTVMINAGKVPLLFGNSTFRYFVGPLPDGVTILTITVQNDYGGVNTKQVALTVP